MIYYLLSCCAIHGLSNGQENAENTAENNAYSTPIEDTAQFHKQNQERRRVKCDFLKEPLNFPTQIYGMRWIQPQVKEVQRYLLTLRLKPW